MGGAVQDLDVWLEPFLAVLGHRKRRTWAPLYLRGLLGPSERKSLQPMATSLGLSGHDQLQHFIASRPGTTHRCGGCWPRKPTGRWAGRKRRW
jgi:SRSO17 transposase